MKILALTAGAARMYCGSCLRDNALAGELKRQGHDIILLPLYTPTRTDELNQSYGRVFLNGISVCLDQQSEFFRRPHPMLDRLWEAGWMIRLASRTSIEVDPHVLGAMTVSMLRGEQGNQLKEIRKLTAWLESEPPPDLITLPNSLLIGLARPLRSALRRPICCTLQGEELFLSQLIEPYREQALELIRAQLDEVDGFVAVSDYSAEYWVRTLGIADKQMHVVSLGINCDGLQPGTRPAGQPFTIGYLARVAPEKGLVQLAESYCRLRKELGFGPSRLTAAGYLAHEHRGYLAQAKQTMRQAGLAHEFQYLGELDRAAKVAYLARLDAFSVPAAYDEPKGISILEALAAGVPVVEPRRGALTEIVERTGGGILVEPDDVAALADGLHRLAIDRNLREQLGRAGAANVREHYSAAHMGMRAIAAYERVMGAAVHA